MEPFLQNVAQVLGEQTAQIAQVSQRVDQLVICFALLAFSIVFTVSNS